MARSMGYGHGVCELQFGNFILKALCQGCQIFLGPNIPKRGKNTKGPQTTPNSHVLYQRAINYTVIAIKYTNIFSYKGPPQYTQIGILVLKLTIWQPCRFGLV
jgi:hypothetical protein